MKTKTANRSKKSRKPQDAIALLRADHASVSALFADYAKARSASRKLDLVARICAELGVHAQIEEEIFYPAVKQALKDKELVPEATVEHATLKALIAQVQDEQSVDEMFDAKIQVMSEYVKHHVKEEQTEMFPKARKAAELDMEQLGAELADRKARLLADKPGATARIPARQPRRDSRQDGAAHRSQG